MALNSMYDPHIKIEMPHVMKYADGSWFVPKNSGLGPPFVWVKAFVQYDDTVCVTMTSLPNNHQASSMDQIIGLHCIPKGIQ